MEADWIAALATSGATALVAAAATDTWQSTREAFGRVFHRAGREDVVTGELDRVAAQLDAAGDGREAARAALTGQWAARLREVLERHPEAAADIQAAIDRARGSSAATPRDAAVGELSVRSARDVYVSGRDQTITHHHAPGTGRHGE
ncbi:hypothetical protein ACIPRD_07705 [Streptomyces sp. NPDC090108]|uniref:hypothetical protein n=1 Tax=Streptomyces sp. NPDC090108 TaxID=3365947 RepID=UPI0037F22D65